MTSYKEKRDAIALAMQATIHEPTKNGLAAMLGRMIMKKNYGMDLPETDFTLGLGAPDIYTIRRCMRE